MAYPGIISPEKFRSLRQAFDVAWSAIEPTVTKGKDIEARERLAKILLSLSAEGVTDLDVLAVSATGLFNQGNAVE